MLLHKREHKKSGYTDKKFKIYTREDHMIKPLHFLLPNTSFSTNLFNRAHLTIAPFKPVARKCAISLFKT
jgi:hypothetical protein